MAQAYEQAEETPRGEARDPPGMLAGFIRYLEEAGLLEFHVVGRGDYAIDNGVRIHAMVLLANRLGLGAPYECDTYAYGPRSSSLTEDYFALSEDRQRLYSGVPAGVPASFRRDEFERLVRGRDLDWLMAASSLADMRPYRSTRDRLIDAIDGHRPAYTWEYLSGVLDDLERAKVIRGYT